MSAYLCSALAIPTIRLHAAFELDVGLFGVKDSPNRPPDYWKRESLNKDIQIVVQRRTGEI
jgi:hypothetical protein